MLHDRTEQRAARELPEIDLLRKCSARALTSLAVNGSDLRRTYRNWSPSNRKISIYSTRASVSYLRTRTIKKSINWSLRFRRCLHPGAMSVWSWTSSSQVSGFPGSNVSRAWNYNFKLLCAALLEDSALCRAASILHCCLYYWLDHVDLLGDLDICGLDEAGIIR